MRTAFKKISSVVGCAAVLATLVSAAPAPENTAAPGTLKLKVSLQAPQAVAGSERSLAAAGCAPGENRYNRTQSCIKAPGKLNITRNGRLEGVIRFTVTQAMQLHNSRNFSEKYTFKVTGIAGNTSAVTAAFNVSCGGSCRATNHVRGPRAVRAGTVISGPVNYHDSTNTQHRDRAKYSLTFLKPGYTTGLSRWESMTFRCDDIIRGSGIGAGCVFPRYAPVLTTMANLPHIRTNIKRIQQAGPHHYGKRGNSPLTRATSTAVERANRRVACPRNRPGRPAGHSCDEYPFAKTFQGASRTRKPDWGWAWVPAREQHAQGGYLSSFYAAQRVMNKDKFWVAV